MKQVKAFLLLWVLGLASLHAAETDFPYRARYPDAPTLSTTELKARLGAIVVVDVRSRYEYETLHIKDAVNLPSSDKDFTDRVKALAGKDGKAITFYCNGRTCHKSYDAAILALRARVANVSVYDAGIFEWAKTYPEHTVLFDKSPIEASDLIDHERFRARLLDAKEFANRVGPRSVVLDIRDRAQRDNMLFPFKEQRAQLDEKAKIDAALAQAKREGKTLLVYDATGKQVQWFQYYLENQGIKDYYFMKDGAQGYYDATLGKVILGKAAN